ncbi:MAG: branched-chain amino acid ABC transporter permease [Chloroflexi bacterium]|nr:branched-chain amino acid ABC transporter permease [Chloroflexota bacterium]
MSHFTQALRLDRLDLDYDRISGQYFGFGAVLATLRMLWVIARTSELFGSSPDAFYQSFEDGLGILLWAYAVTGLVGVGLVLVARSRAEGTTANTRLLINYLGVLLFLVASLRVVNVVTSDPKLFTDYWGRQLVNGLVLGGVYALVALGYTLVYGVLFMINFAHGEVLILGSFGGWFAWKYVFELGNESFEVGAAMLSTVLVPVLFAVLFLPLEALAERFNQRGSTTAEVSGSWGVTLISLPLRLIAGAIIGFGVLKALGGYAPHVYWDLTTIVALVFIVLVGMIASMLVAIALERIAYRPLRGAPRLTPLISAIGASFFLQQAMLNVFGQEYSYERPPLIDGNIDVQIGDMGTVPVPKTGIIIVVVSLAMMVFLYLFIQRSKTGRAMRAVAEDKSTAALMGVNVDRVIVVTFALGALLAGAAGVMRGFHDRIFKYNSGFTPGLKAFTAAVVGGIGSIPGAMFGGFFLGLVEALGPGMLGIPTEYKDVIAFSLLVLVLIFRPTGIFGDLASEKKV